LYRFVPVKAGDGRCDFDTPAPVQINQLLSLAAPQRTIRTTAASKLPA
jgi:hypothetical protein